MGPLGMPELLLVVYIVLGAVLYLRWKREGRL